MKIYSFCSLFLPLALLAIAAPLSAATYTTNPTAHAFVSSANTSGNFGGGGALGVSAAGLTKGELQTLMLFNLSGAKTQFDITFGIGGWTVDSISLQLAAANPGASVFNSSASGNIGVRWFGNDSWIEGSGTPASPGATGVNFNDLAGLLASGTGPQTAGSLAFLGGTSGFNSINLSGSAGLTADVLAGSTASLDFYATDTTASAVFNSRSFSTSANWPILTLNASAIPEPSLGILSALMLILPVFRRSR